MLPVPLHPQHMYSRKILTTSPSNLIAYWPLWESAGSNISDASGNGRVGTATGFNWLQPGIGDGKSAPSLDGTTSWGNIYSASFVAAFNGLEGTMQLWCKVSGAGIWTDGVNRYPINLAVDGNNTVNIRRAVTNNNLTWEYKAGAVSKAIGPLSFGAPISWFHTAITWSKSADQVKVYVNGVQQSGTLTGLATWAGTLASTACLIGAGANTPSSIWSGNLADIAIWNTPLAASQISYLARLQ